MGKMAELHAQKELIDEIESMPSKKGYEYNGWTNYETWNVMLYLNNDEPYYRQISKILEKGKECHGNSPYETWVEEHNLQSKKTPDGVGWLDCKVNLKEINEHLLDWYHPSENKADGNFKG